MSSNLYKSNSVVMKDNDMRVIDTNNLVARKLDLVKELLNKSSKSNHNDGFTGGIEAKCVEILLEDESEDSELYAARLNEKQGEIDEMMQRAQAEIEERKAQAEAEIEFMKNKGYEEGLNKGYQDGFKQGNDEANAQWSMKQRELVEQCNKQQQDYEKAMNELEPMLVEQLFGIFQHVFGSELRKHRDVLTYLITTTIYSVDGARDFLIHLSKEDYPFVTMQRSKIEANLNSNSTMEFIEDSTVVKGGCLIETSNGIFDCGVDTQMEELGRQLKLLSYEKV